MKRWRARPRRAVSAGRLALPEDDRYYEPPKATGPEPMRDRITYQPPYHTAYSKLLHDNGDVQYRYNLSLGWSIDWFVEGRHKTSHRYARHTEACKELWVKYVNERISRYVFD